MPESEQGQARDKAAAVVGVSPRYVSDAKRQGSRLALLIVAVADDHVEAGEHAQPTMA